MTRLTRAFSVSFTTGPFGPSRIRLFEASPYRVGFEGPEYRSQSVTVLLLHLSYSTMRFRIFMSQSPRVPHRTVLDTLASYGSCHRKKARRLSVASLGSSRFRLAQRNCNDPPPSLHGHYTHFITTMGQSDPERCIGTFGLMAVATCAFSLGITVQVHLFCTKARMKVTPPEHRTPHGL